MILSILDFPGVVRGQLIKDVAVQGERVYAISNTLSAEPARLYIVDVEDSASPQLLSATTLPTANPTGLASQGNMVYVAAEEVGLLVFDVHEPTAPILMATLMAPEPDDDVEVSLSSGIALVEDFAYVVETQRNRITNESTDVLTVLDLRMPEAPRRRGSVQLTARPQLPLSGGGVAVADGFAYVVRGVFGLEALDIRDPDAPRRVGFVDTPGEALQVATADTLIYVSDSVFDLQVIQGPGTVQTDTDSDGIIDFFDAFPTDATETQDSDGDRVGDNADPDDDNDGFTDAEEEAATPPTRTTNPLAFPVQAPPTGVTRILVDAATTLTARERQGTSEAPYRSVTEALRALHSGLAPDVRTLRIRPGIYSPLTTQEVIPLDLGRLSNLTVQGDEPGNVVLDGGLRGDVISAEFSENLVIERLVVTHGATGLRVRESSNVTIRDNQIRSNNEDGIEIGLNANTGIAITDNLVEDNGNYGIHVNRNAAATVMGNTVRTNASDGIFVTSGSSAEISGNVVEKNTNFGILVAFNSTATITETISSQNENEGIVIFGNSTAMVTRNTLSANRNDGIVIDVNSTAELHDNTIVGNGFPPNPDFPDFLPTGSGVIVAGGSVVTISGGVITQSRRHGIHVFLSPLNPEPATVLVGLDSNVTIEISENGKAGIFVDDDGSLAEIDSRQIVFDGNAEGDTVGNVVDVAPGP